ncbi:sensor histidine kinase [Peteryoungia ipomoeae]|uniref:histidine kinase n=1 Tax=Peteryoungia ipomoeae TaxID=1210932 RepID=A0A4S8P327_9HYPH|nr:PAS-domain containing protein [Peteryoungia ipomoeae]THV23232.1 PAS domain S-box protein [Peteryoungia ipomoeae]
MPSLAWKDLPEWTIVADRAILQVAASDRRLSDMLTTTAGIITALADFDLLPTLAFYVHDPQSSRYRLIHHVEADEIRLPIDLIDGRLPLDFHRNMGHCVYEIPLKPPYGDEISGTLIAFGRSAEPMKHEVYGNLEILAAEIAGILARRHGSHMTLLDMVELSTDEIYIFDPKSLTIIRTNATACLRTGFTEQALSEMKPSELKIGLSEADYRARIEPLLSGQRDSVLFDSFQKRRNGTVYPVKIQVWRIRGQDADIFAEVVIASADQRKAFGLLEQVFDAIPGGIGVFDAHSRLVMANRRLYDLMNLPPEQFPPGSYFEDILRYNVSRGEWGEGDHEAMIRERVEQAELGLSYSFERERTSGKVLAVRSEPLSNGGYVLSYSDITLRKRAEKDLIRNRDELEITVRERTAEIAAQAAALEEALQQEKAINAMQRQFLTMTSHEFRTPLAIIDGAAQRIQRKKGEIGARFLADKTQQIRSAVARMVELMESFLSAGSMDTGKLELTLVECSVKTLMNQAIQRQKLSSPHHRFDADISGLPPVMRCDALAISQVLSNLLSNAVKYSPRAPEIAVRGWTEDDHAFISVRDCGIGIDQADIPQLFQPYFRARTSTGIAGTGIGLSLVRQIVTLHDGDIFVESRLGAGSTFTLALPIKGPVARPQTQQENAA